MDLGAYAQIDDLRALASANNIDIPRPRGYRLMSDEQAIPQEEIERIVRDAQLDACENACRSEPLFNPNSNTHVYCSRTDWVVKKYCVFDSEDDMVGFRWDLLRGKRKKKLKLAMKHCRKNILNNLETFNRYAGRDDVLYIHARIGGHNWLDYGGADIERQPWFLEKADDIWDDTYCDIYALVDRNKV